MKFKVTFFYSQALEMENPTQEKIETIGNDTIKRMSDLNGPMTFNKFLRAEIASTTIRFAERTKDPIDV